MYLPRSLKSRSGVTKRLSAPRFDDFEDATVVVDEEIPGSLFAEEASEVISPELELRADVA